MAAVISVIEPSCDRQGHWLLPCGGSPRAIAALLAAPLRSSGQPARSWREWLAVLAPLSPLMPLPESSDDPQPSEPVYRYLLCLPAGHRDPTRISCWRRYPEGLGWQRRCGPMPLAVFVERFTARAAGGLAPIAGPMAPPTACQPLPLSCSGAAAPSVPGG